jgi:hypothetical protein
MKIKIFRNILFIILASILFLYSNCYATNINLGYKPNLKFTGKMIHSLEMKVNDIHSSVTINYIYKMKKNDEKSYVFQMNELSRETNINGDSYLERLMKIDYVPNLVINIDGKFLRIEDFELYKQTLLTRYSDISNETDLLDFENKIDTPTFKKEVYSYYEEMFLNMIYRWNGVDPAKLGQYKVKKNSEFDFEKYNIVKDYNPTENEVTLVRINYKNDEAIQSIIKNSSKNYFIRFFGIPWESFYSKKTFQVISDVDSLMPKTFVKVQEDKLPNVESRLVEKIFFIKTSNKDFGNY